MGERVELVVPGHAAYLAVVRELFPGLAREWKDLGLTEAEVLEIQLVLQEACTNAIRHAHGRRKDLPIRVVFEARDHELRIEVHDRGRGFDPDGVPEPKCEMLQEGGYGVFIMKNSMDRVEGRRSEEGFTLRLTKICTAVVGEA